MTQWKQVVVGVDGSEHSKRAVQRASDEASKHGAELLVVSTWPTPLGTRLAAPPAEVSDQLAQDTEAMLRKTLSETLGDSPQVPVNTTVTQGYPAQVLIELSDGADLLVVGSRGLGGFAGLLLGSVSQHVTTNARCTVAVVR